MVNEDIKDKILNYLHNVRIGATISDIARELGVSRPTVYKYLGELKAEGLIKEISIGAYKLYAPSDRFESEVRMISKKLLCALAYTFNKMFSGNKLELSCKLGSSFVDSFFSLYKEELKKIDIISSRSPFDKIKLVLGIFLGREIRTDVIELEENRCVVRFEGEMCVEESTLILIAFLKGAIKRFLELISGKKLVFGSENIRKIDENVFDVAIELKLVSS